jgi:hypothetical protein
MRIYTLWHEGQGGDLPWLVGAVDEYTVDENRGKFPENYAELRARVYHRELIIDIPQKAVSALFESPEVEAKVVKE